jgi:hypothetical protein
MARPHGGHLGGKSTITFIETLRSDPIHCCVVRSNWKSVRVH